MMSLQSLKQTTCRWLQRRSLAVAAITLLLSIPLAFVSARTVANELRPEPMDLSPLVSEQNRLSIDMLRRLCKADDKNIFCSPMNIHMALSLLEPAAKGPTKEELRSLLYRDKNTDSLFRPFIEQMTDQDQTGVEISMGSNLWLRSGLDIRAKYESLLADRFAGVEHADFHHEQDESIAAINDWVSDATAGRIPKLASRDTVTKDTLMFLASAIYFKGSWSESFSKQRTRPRTFHLADGTTKEVPMMQKNIRIQTMDGDTYRIGILPYGDKIRRMEMVILLPDSHDGLSSMIDQMDLSTLNTQLAKRPKRRRTLVTLPKFELSSSYDLIPHLQQMGIETAFTNAADFSGITKQDRIKLSAVLHKAVIQVDEEGTVAAAVTGVGGIRATSVPAPPPTFNVDRPFAFLIRDNQTGSILFVGRVNDPSTK
ncbi:serpin family protein [Crateriforma spongiae]|uniref:serpin family protein n=1 Tax=Crateriforma spongiae TaxID=2724528 RepID=UPI00144886CF|nr:serpin family protein [Crateriforma spongiae]